MLEAFREAEGAPDRAQVVAHAVLSALVHHWPSRARPEWSELLARTARVKDSERSRWVVQRRLAIAHFARTLCE